MNRYALLNSFLFISSLKITAKQFSIKKLIFIDQNNNERELETDFNVEINKYLVYDDLSKMVSSNNVTLNGIIEIYKDFKIDTSNLEKDNSNAVFDKFYLLKIANTVGKVIYDFDETNEKEICLTFKLLPKIDLVFADEDKISKDKLNYIKEFLEKDFNNNEFYPLNTRHIARMSNIKIINLKEFTDIKGNVHNADEDLTNVDCYLDCNCVFKIELDKNNDNKIYNTNVIYYLNKVKKDEFNYIGTYNLNEFNAERFIFFNDKNELKKYFIYKNVKNETNIDKDNRKIEINIEGSNVVRYKIISENLNPYILYSEKLKERDLINYIEPDNGYSFFLEKDSIKVNSEQELDEGEYKLKKGEYKYNINNQSFILYKKITTDELKQMCLKNKYNKDFQNRFISEKNDDNKVFKPTEILEPGEYNFGIYENNGKVLSYNEIDKFYNGNRSEGDSTVYTEKKDKNKCCCY